MTCDPTPDPDDLKRVIAIALEEDLGPDGLDLTSAAVIPGDAMLAAQLVARENMVVAGLGAALTVFTHLAPTCRTDACVAEGDKIQDGTVLGRIEGPARALLTAERTALNLLQHLCGIATLTRQYVDQIGGTKAVLLDTRKTIAGLRKLSKYATFLGGATNHRMGLYDAVLIKDNHVALGGGIAATVKKAQASGAQNIEVECDTLEQLSQALEAGAARILLDNMSLEELRQAVAINNRRAVLEASGGVTLETIGAIAQTGVDFISVGRLTQSAPAMDIGLDFIPVS